MEKDYGKILLSFYKNKINVGEFVKFLNSEEEMQNIFNKFLKSYKAPSDTSIVARINDDFSKIGTAQDRKLANSGESSRLYSIKFLVKELLLKKYFTLMDKEDIDKYVLREVETGWLDNASKEVEGFIMDKVLKDMPAFAKPKDAISYAKSKVNELFVCEKKMPYWIQSCDWAFDKDGKPMTFVSQKREGEKVEYLFSSSKETKTVVQYY